MSASLDHLGNGTLGRMQYVLGAQENRNGRTSGLSSPERLKLEPLEGNTYAWFVGEMGGIALDLSEAVVAMSRAIGRTAGVVEQKKFLLDVALALR